MLTVSDVRAPSAPLVSSDDLTGNTSRNPITPGEPYRTRCLIPSCRMQRRRTVKYPRQRNPRVDHPQLSNVTAYIPNYVVMMAQAIYNTIYLAPRSGHPNPYYRSKNHRPCPKCIPSERYRICDFKCYPTGANTAARVTK